MKLPIHRWFKYSAGFSAQWVESVLADHIAEKGELLCGDARNFPQVQDRSVDLVITSPPYANNYDYADATRFEMSFWEEISSWGDLHESVRKYLIRSSSQHASKERLELNDLLSEEAIAPIATELAKVCNKLSEERLLHGGKNTIIL